MERTETTNPEASMPAKSTKSTKSTASNTTNGDLVSVARKAAVRYLDGVEETVQRIGDFQITFAERYLGKAGGSLAEAQAKAANDVTAALVRVQREVIGA
jgi:hypothetical protein